MIDSVKVDFLVNVPHTLDDISRWLNEEFLYDNPGETVEMRKEKMWKRAFTDKIPFCMVATLEGNAVATASIVENDLAERSNLTPWLASVFTKKEYRNLGIGSHVCKTVVKEFFKLGISDCIYLYTPDQENFYKLLGWETTEKMNYVSKDITIMVKNR